MIKQTITLPYLEKILISKKRNPRYYNLTKKKGTNKIPPSYSKKIGSKYEVDSFGFLIDKITREKIISNPRTVGKPKYWVVNVQDLYNGVIKPQMRAGLMLKIKEHMRPYIIKSGIKIRSFNIFEKFISYFVNINYLRIELFIYSEFMPVDCDNKGFLLHKNFQDLLKEQGIIPDDCSKYIRDSSRTIWVPTIGKETMEFVITEI